MWEYELRSWPSFFIGLRGSLPASRQSTRYTRAMRSDLQTVTRVKRWLSLSYPRPVIAKAGSSICTRPRKFVHRLYAQLESLIYQSLNGTLRLSRATNEVKSSLATTLPVSKQQTGGRVSQAFFWNTRHPRFNVLPEHHAPSSSLRRQLSEHRFSLLRDARGAKSDRKRRSGRLPFAPEMEEGADESAPGVAHSLSACLHSCSALQASTDLALCYATTAS